MKMNFNLELIQTQKLVITPELKQAIEILQYNSMELNEFVKEELLSNPILQKESTESIEVPSGNKEDYLEKINWKEVASDYNNDPSYRKYATEERDEINYDNFVASEDTLVDHLMFQLQFALLEDEEIEIAEYVIENIDSNGYLDIDADHLADRFMIDRNAAEDIIQTIQTFEPSGVAARSLEECLLIQARQQFEDSALIEQVIIGHLDDLASNRINVIAKKLGVSIPDVQEACDQIKQLEPKPGRIYASLNDVRYVTPDVFVKLVDGEYVVTISESSAPKLIINKYYQSILEKGTEDQAMEYINKKLTSALRLIKSIEQRKSTILKVVHAILEYQKDFFEKGAMYLKPMTLKDIAEEIEVHESTVSRAVNGKYMQCPAGLFEIKYFFQSGVSSAYGDGVSSESIKVLIKNMVDEENPKKPVSDQHISNELNQLGIKVSRRTIAKYRDELCIPSSSKRKRY